MVGVAEGECAEEEDGGGEGVWEKGEEGEAEEDWGGQGLGGNDVLWHWHCVDILMFYSSSV
jgi:hypothetical protein